MSEPSKRRTGLYAAMVAAAVAMIAIANWTTAVDTLLSKWQEWAPAVGYGAQAILPFVPAGIVLYGSTALLITAYRGWREGKRIQTAKRRDEIENLARHVKIVLWEIEQSFKKRGAESDYRDFEHPLVKLKEALVLSAIYDRRLTLFTVVNNMEQECRKHREGIPQVEMEPYLDALRRWAAWAEWEVTPEVPSRPRDPFAPN